MLRCNMPHPLETQLALEDLLADLHHARRHDQLGRLALLAYCEVKVWARRAGKPDVADKALQIFSDTPSRTRDQFLESIDSLIETLNLHEQEFVRSHARQAREAGAATIHELRAH